MSSNLIARSNKTKGLPALVVRISLADQLSVHMQVCKRRYILILCKLGKVLEASFGKNGSTPELCPHDDGRYAFRIALMSCLTRKRM